MIMRLNNEFALNCLRFKRNTLKYTVIAVAIVAFDVFKHLLSLMDELSNGKTSA